MIGFSLGIGVGGGGRLRFLPSAIFTASEPGAWYDPSDLTTLFQDSAGATPVTTAGQTVGKILDKSGRGNHATQATLAQRPTYQIDGTGRPYLSFDGVDDGMATGTITPGINKVQVFAGIRRISDALSGVLAEFSPALGSNAGSWHMLSPAVGGTAGSGFASKGTVQAANNTASPAAPITEVLTGIGDISGDTNIFRKNSVPTSILTDQGTGNFLPYVLYIGRRGGTTLPFNGRIYSLIMRFGANLTAGQIASTEAYVNGKTGAY